MKHLLVWDVNSIGQIELQFPTDLQNFQDVIAPSNLFQERELRRQLKPFNFLEVVPQQFDGLHL